MPLGLPGFSRGRPFSRATSVRSPAISSRWSAITRCCSAISSSRRAISAFNSASDRSSRFPGGGMPLQNLKWLHGESPYRHSGPSLAPSQLYPAKPLLPGLLPLLRCWAGGSNASGQLEQQRRDAPQRRTSPPLPRPGGHYPTDWYTPQAGPKGSRKRSAPETRNQQGLVHTRFVLRPHRSAVRWRCMRIPNPCHGPL